MNSNYLLIAKEKSDNAKRLQKSFKKTGANKLFSYSYYKNDFQKQSLELLLDFLLLKKKSSMTNKTTYLGVLTDDNKLLVKDFLSVPMLPDTWDILFLEYKLRTIDYMTQNVGWKRVTVEDTRHFLINPASLTNVINMLKSSNTWSDFVEGLNNMHSYGIQNMFISEPKNNSSINRNNTLDYNTLVDKFTKLKSKYTPDKLYTLYPGISLICCISDHKKFFHALYTFLSLDYPTDKLELVIVDDTDLEKRVSKYIPNDSRIRFVNIKPKENDTIPLGYKLNVSIQYCKYDLIFHFFDTNVYLKHNFKHIIECYILSNKDALVGMDSYNYSNVIKETSSVSDLLDLGNMMYTKKFWETFNFKTIESDYSNLAFKFTSFRENLIGYIPSILWSFNVRNTNLEKTSPLTFNLKSLLEEKDLQSFNINH